MALAVLRHHPPGPIGRVVVDYPDFERPPSSGTAHAVEQRDDVLPLVVGGNDEGEEIPHAGTGARSGRGTAPAGVRGRDAAAAA